MLRADTWADGDGDLSPKRQAFIRQINLQKLRDKAQKSRSDLLGQFETHLSELVDDILTDVDDIEQKPPDAVGDHVKKKRDEGSLPDKEFVARRSILTELLEIDHIRTIYHIFVAILIVFSLQTLVYDWIEKENFLPEFELITWAFGKFPIVITLWVGMVGCTMFIVYPMFSYWAAMRSPGKGGVADYIWLTIYLIYQVLFITLPIYWTAQNELPIASKVIVASEQVRLIMKAHAFIRSNIPGVIQHKKNDELSSKEGTVPDFSKYLYFLFAPTLVYRNSYPRTATIRWNYVFTNFAQVFACLFYVYYIFARFCVPVFKNFSQESVTPKKLLFSVFGCMLPGTLVLFITFFAVLHSWLNAFAEMLRFGDRLFYKDWWNSSSFANYYRTWNVVVHDWLYTYVYKDFYWCCGKSSRPAAMAIVFLLSAVVHEYILSVSFGFFYPVLFILFAGAGFGFVFLNDRRFKRSGNIFMWVALFMGTGILMCLYSMEWYARQNCPITTDSFIDYLIPRSWTCDVLFEGL
ncbi:sterol O-acyltransferase 1-like isoform X2 [Lineus longissimus]|uniref:sterol O-acyltransferase 1-like isoform X2 n=1 Tax=Lineus longissimus TaxID=88925 RepID=UPI00315D58CF